MNDDGLMKKMIQDDLNGFSNQSAPARIREIANNAGSDREGLLLRQEQSVKDPSLSALGTPQSAVLISLLL
jgi:hypothetical protein